MRIPIGDRVLDCTNHTAIMGIVNVGTDSPVAESVLPGAAPDEKRAAAAVLARARRLIEQGAALIDVGAHSTRSGGEAPSPQEEIDRLCPVVEALAGDGILVSVDTWRGAVARAVVQAGAHVLNDVSAGSDPETARVAAEFDIPIVVMHMRGRPKQHRLADQRYQDVGAEVRAFLRTRSAELEAAGVRRIWLDPGYEFAKSATDNVRMLVDTPQLLRLGRPVLVSASRKGFLAELLGHPKLPSAEVQSVDGLAEATLAFNTLAARLGVHIVRVHDVEATARAIRVVDAVRRAGGAPGERRAGGALEERRAEGAPGESRLDGPAAI